MNHSPSLPAKALREAIVNAVMHRSYRVESPIQIIRYSNRIEIMNAGFSLKSEDRWFKPGSEHRNKNLAAIFHETNTAETKGTGINYMRKKMIEAGFSPPTFESNRDENRFSSEFFLHLFLSESGLGWLSQINAPLSEGQKYALIAVRENLRIDNRTLRQLTGNDIFAASSDLRKLCDSQMLEKKGAGSATFYVKSEAFPPEIESEEGELTPEEGGLAPEEGGLAPEEGGLAPEEGDFPESLRKKIENLGPRSGAKALPLILEICSLRPTTAHQLAAALGKKDINHLKRNLLRPLVEQGQLEYLYPNNIKHPHQAYRTKTP